MIRMAERQAPLLLVLQFLDTEAVVELTTLVSLQAEGLTRMETGGIVGGSGPGVSGDAGGGSGGAIGGVAGVTAGINGANGANGADILGLFAALGSVTGYPTSSDGAASPTNSSLTANLNHGQAATGFGCGGGSAGFWGGNGGAGLFGGGGGGASGLGATQVGGNGGQGVVVMQFN